MTNVVPLPTVPGQEYGHTPADHARGHEQVLGRRADQVWEQAIVDWAVWMHGQGRSALTVRQWGWMLRRLGEDHVRRSPWKLTTEDLWRWYGSVDGWSAPTRKNARSAVCSFYGWAAKHGRVKRDPSASLDGVKVSQGLPRPAPDSVIEAALAGASDKMRLMILLGGKAGLRCTEMASLRWADVGDSWLIVRGKGERERRVPVHPELGTALEAERSRRLAGRHGTGYRYASEGGVWVFPGKSGPHMGARHVSAQLSAALGPGVTAHMLRHRAATAALDATGNLAAVQELLGHASPTTTRIYSRVSDAALQAAVGAL